uniref:Histidinol dehydrogenase n=1 Tax=Aegilops tauschii subsp. strangulata TaxID=200361 RepID=A0A453BXB6_AEGTS
MGSLRAPPQLAGGTSLGRGYRPCLASSGVPKSKVLSVSCPMKSYRLSDLSDAEVSGLKARPRIDFTSIFSTVNPIVEDVRVRGDAAVKDYTEKFDKVTLDNAVVRVSDLPDAELDPAVKEAFDVAYDNIYAFHVSQKSPEKTVENMKEVLYCAKKAGVTHILKAGGAQAISAMAWGTASCPKVEKIFGPGNQYVTAAKMILQNSEAMVSIDMPAGPSEVLVIADKYANPVHVAADLLSQAEHGPDSQVVLVIAGDGVDLGAIEAEVSKQCDALPRGDFASKALGHSFTVFARDMVEALSFSNMYAPEHLIINVKDAEQWEELIENGQFSWDNGPPRAWVTTPVGRTTSSQPTVTRGCTAVCR